MKAVLAMALPLMAVGAAAANNTPITYNWEISFANVVTWSLLIIGAIVWAAKRHSSLESLEKRMGVLQDELKEISRTLTTLGQHEIRFTEMQRQIGRLQDEVDMLRRGDGFILPTLTYRPPEPG